MKTFKTPKGTELPLQSIQGKPYLGIQQRIQWFCEEHPNWSIETECLLTSEKESKFKSTIRDETGRIIRQGHKREDSKGFPDHYEKAETGSIGRALGLLGYGTQFALEFEEGNRLADAPSIEKPIPPKKPSAPMLGDTPKNSHPMPEDVVIRFGKHKDKTVGELINELGAGAVNSYIAWLQGKSREDGKPISQSAAEFIEAAQVVIDEMFKPPKSNFDDVNAQLANIKNEFSPPNFDDSEQIPF